jgi:TPR repeat protein
MNLGLEHGMGKLLPRDDAAALRFLGMACDRAKADACATIADVLAARGQAAGAVAFARRACWMNDRRSCAVVGMAYHQGRGVAADETQAVAWMREACRSGDALGCGVLVQRDLDLPLPPDFRAEMYRRLCTEGVQAACGR